jgi:hypothetical protein
MLPEMCKYLPDGCIDPVTFDSVMDAANAKYHIAKVIDQARVLRNIPYFKDRR